MSELEQEISNGSQAEEPTEAPAAAAAEAQESGEPGAVAFPYATAGAAFTNWFNERIRRLPNPTLRLGTKTATVLELHADGRLQLSLHAAAGEAEEAFVQFEATHLDQLLLKFAAQGA